MGKLFELVSSGVGLAAEAVAQNTNKSSSSRIQGSRHESNDSLETYRHYQEPSYETRSRARYWGNGHDQENDHQRWRSEYTQDDYGQSRHSNYGGDDGFYRRYDPREDERGPSMDMVPFNNRQFQAPHTPLTVIIPQRRPGTKDRGWAIAYAPVLQRFGIERDTFVNFLWSFNESCKASPALDAVNIAAFGVGFAPGIAPMVVSTVVPMVVTAAKTTQTNTQSSNFLAKANAEIFEPRGLVAVVTTFRTEEQSAVVSVNVDSRNQMRSTQPTQENLEENQYNAEYMLQTAAPLVYIHDEEMVQRQDQNSFLKTSHFVADFMDKRTQARMSTKFTGAQGSFGPKPNFRSRWGDPNSAANNGGLIGLVSGGLISRPRKDKDDKNDKEDEKKRKKEEKKRSDGILRTAGGAIMGQRGQKNELGGPIKGLKSQFAPNHDILYLMIVVKE